MFFPAVLWVVSSNSLTSCQNKHLLSSSHVSRDLFQGRVVLVYAAVLSGSISAHVSNTNRLSACHLLTIEIT